MDINEKPKGLSSVFRRFFKNRKTIQGMMIFLVGYFLFFLLLQYDVRYYNSDDIIRLLVKIVPMVIAVTGIGYMLFGYLEGSVIKKETEQPITSNLKFNEELALELRKYLDEFRHYQERGRHETMSLIENLRQQFEHQKEFQLNELQKAEIFNSLKQSFAENVNEDFFKQLNENISYELTKEKRGRLETLLKDFSSIKLRLNSEIDKLSRKANVNLVIGSLTTIVALMALGVVVFQSQGSFVSLTDMLYHYVPRLSLIIFIEVFAYFFLRLYKLNLNDMKYFQNELTTVELKLVSISTAINFGKDIDISAITIELSKTERNFILKKGETTVELEKSRIGKTDLKEILKSITDIAKGQK